MKYTTKVAGVAMEGRQAILAEMYRGQAIQIRPEPNNPYDANALAVHISPTVKCGYIPRDVAASVVKQIPEAVIGRVVDITGGFTTRDGEIAHLGLLIEFEIED